MDPGHPLQGMTDLWENTIDDMEATAEELREAGWETVEVHPGAVTPLPRLATDDGYEDDRTGFDVLTPGNEFEAVQEAVEGAEFDEYEAYNAETNDVVFAVVVMKAADADRAVLIPIYYETEEAEETVRRIEAEGESRLYVRPLDDSERVLFVQQSPEALLPGEE
jgi:uroporphyrinogen-III synthase